MTVSTGDPPSPRLLRLGDLLADFDQDAAEAHDALTRGIPRGPVTGLPSLDKELGGALVPGLHILHAGPGAGKSALVLQGAASCQCPALLVQCEMGPLETLRRLIARTQEVPLDRLRAGAIKPAEASLFARRAAAECSNLALVDATTAFPSPDYLRTAARAVKGESKHLLIVVDSVHSWTDGAGMETTEYEALNAALAALRSLAHSLACPILAVAERNRAGMKNGGLSAGAGTRKFEYGSETLWELEREEKETKNGAGEVPVTLTLRKNRCGVKDGEVKLLWHGAFQRFRDPKLL